MLGIQPSELCKLRVRLTAMVDEACEVTLSPLPNLIARFSRTIHDIQMPNTLGYQTNEFADC
jgi:hypothetical protein